MMINIDDKLLDQVVTTAEVLDETKVGYGRATGGGEANGHDRAALNEVYRRVETARANLFTTLFNAVAAAGKAARGAR